MRSHRASSYGKVALIDGGGTSRGTDRLALYIFAQRLSLTAGPLRLLDGDFPDRAFLRDIAEHNSHEAPALLRAV